MPYKPAYLSALIFVFLLPTAQAEPLNHKVQMHPSVQAAQHAYCAARYGVHVQRAGYLPSVDFKLSANDKPVNETTRADEFGGENSPEYDGEGVDAELSVTQPIYDWGKTKSDIGIAKARRMKEQLIYTATYDQNSLQLLSAVLLYQSQDAGVKALQKNVRRLQGNRKAVETQVRLGYTAKRALNDYDLLLLDRESMLAEAELQKRETGIRLVSEYDIDAKDVPTLAQQLAAKLPRAMMAVTPGESLVVRQMDEDIRIFDLQAKRIRAQGLPKIEARMGARNWDLTQSDLCTDIAPDKTDCRTYDVTGSLEFSMPLYTGGAQSNQKRALLSKKSEMQARRSILINQNEQENINATQRLDVLSNRLLAAEEKVGLLTSQLEIERKRQKTNAIRFNVIAELDSALADAKLSVTSLAYEIQLAHARQLARNGRLAQTLELNSELPSCRM